jgi:hypothetical protein
MAAIDLTPAAERRRPAARGAAIRSLLLLLAALGAVLVEAAVPLPAALVLFAASFSAAFGLLVRICRSVPGRGARIAASIVLAVLALPLTVTAGALSVAFVNDLRLSKFSGQLFDHPLPPRSRAVASSSEVGILTGNGNHCDFVARLELASDLAIDQVRAHYERLHLSPAIPGGVDGGLPFIEVARTPRGTYSVDAIDAPYGAGLDMRCH